MDMPTYDRMMNPLLEALHQLGGSGNINEINEKTIELLNLPEEIINEPHGDNSSTSEVEYRLAWTRTYLKKYGLLDNSSRGVWALTKTSNKPITVDPSEVVKKVKDIDKKKKEQEEDTEEYHWEKELKDILLSLEPAQFERLAQRLLRESGFTQVEVTGRSGDGGIDGKGIIKVAGLISFHAMFQCKRYQGSVSPSHIRDFRGALQGRADKGIFITTGFFSRDAIKEAHRDGAPPIDLIDGDELLHKMKELSLGVKKEIIEKITVDQEWFENI